MFTIEPSVIARSKNTHDDQNGWPEISKVEKSKRQKKQEEENEGQCKAK